MRAPSVLFSGYYGFGNTGDEAVLHASVGLLRAHCPEIRIAALSADPAATASACGITAYHRTRPREVLAALRDSDLLLSGGGSLLQDRTSLRSLLYYLAVIRLALAMRRRVMIFAQGIGPLVRPQARRVTASLLARARIITVRDAASRDLLHSLPGAKRLPRIEVTADPAFALEPHDTERVRALLSGAGSGMPLVAVNLRPWPGMETAAQALSEAMRLSGERFSFLACPMQPNEDGPLCNRLAGQSGARYVGEPLSPREWRAVLGGADRVVAARLHALILAASAGVPVCAVAYDPKLTALCARIDGVSLGAPAEVTAAAVSRILRESSGDGTQIARRLEIAGDLRRAAARNVELALEVVGAGAGA